MPKAFYSSHSVRSQWMILSIPMPLITIYMLMAANSIALAYISFLNARSIYPNAS